MAARLFILSALFCFCCLPSTQASDTILVVKDARFDLLGSKQAQANVLKSKMTSNGLYRGFRLQVISTPNRDAAFKLKADLLLKFPEHKTYALFQAPNFKVRFGNFLKREEAERYKIILSRLFAQGIYVVEDGIEYIPKEEDDLIIQ